MFRRFRSPPPNLGPGDGRLAPCGKAPNCVSSQASDPRHVIAPLEFSGSPAQAFDDLERLVASLPRTRIVARSGNYMHAEFTTRLFRFTDDVEFLLDEPAGLIHVRSASRIGRSDFGTNRRRVETIRKLFYSAVASEKDSEG